MRNKYWVDVIGDSQRQLPINILQEYCNRHHSFNTSLKFDEAPQRVCEFYDGESYTSLPPLSRFSGLGIDFAIYRGYDCSLGGSPTVLNVSGITEVQILRWM